MPFCPNCGVELAEGARACPLCGASSVGELDASERSARAGAALKTRGDGFFDPEDSASLTLGEKSTIRWEVISVSTLIGAIAVCGVNFLIEGRIGWALYPLFSLALIWVFLTSLIELKRPPLLGGLISSVALLLFLVALDLIDGRLDWAPRIGLPIALSAELSIALALIAIRLLKSTGLSVIAVAFLAVTLTCLGIEGSLSLALGGLVRIVWSGVVASALVPVSAFLFYLHYRVSKVSNLRRLFRL